MSTWTDEMHARAREVAELYYPDSLHKAFLIHALDEIERLRALTTITDDMVRAAAREFWLSNVEDRVWGEAAWDDMGGSEPCEDRAVAEIAAVHALRAALSPREEG